MLAGNWNRDFYHHAGIEACLAFRQFDAYLKIMSLGVGVREDGQILGWNHQVIWQEDFGQLMLTDTCGKALWEITGNKDVDIVFEHPGESTFPVSVFVVKRGGMVVICAGTTGFNLTMDARFLWMRQKRVQGSHFANLKQASAANDLVINRRIDPGMSEVFPWEDIPAAHEKMLDNKHLPGNMAVLVTSPKPGLRTVEDVLAVNGQAS